MIISGETSAGKSTLINKILNKKIFKCRNLESTPSIVKLRNSDRIRIVTESNTGEIRETDLTSKCNLSSKDGVKLFRKFLKEKTDMTCSKESVQFQSVDIALPIPFLGVRIVCFLFFCFFFLFLTFFLNIIVIIKQFVSLSEHIHYNYSNYNVSPSILFL